MTGLKKCFCLALSALFVLAAPNLRAQPRTLDLEALRRQGVTELQAIDPARIRPLPSDARTLELAPREYVVGKTASGITEKQTGDKLRLILPYRLYRITDQGENIALEPIVEIIGGGMRFLSGNEGYHVRLDIAVVDVNNRQAIRSLPDPVRFLVNADDVDRFTPGNQIEISSTFDFKSIDLYALSPADVVRVRIRPSFLPGPLTFNVKVIRPPISVTVNPPRIYGLGLQTSVITVIVPGVHGGTVSVKADKGSLSVTSIGLDAEGFGSAVIRSLSFGTAEITASYPPVGTAVATLVFDPPWLFLIAAVAGGLAGSAIRLLTAKLKAKSNRAGLIAGRLLRGVLLGILAAAAYTVGVNLTGFSFPAELSGVEEVLTFVIAGLVAYAGKIKAAQSPGD